MSDLELKFNEEDIIKVINEWRKKSLESEVVIEYVTSAVRHDLLSFYDYIDVNIATLLNPLSQYFLNNEIQKMFLESIIFAMKKFTGKSSELIDYMSGSDVDNLSSVITHNYFNELSNFLEFAPILLKLDSIATLNDKQIYYCSIIDSHFEMLAYTNNRLFNSSFKTENYFFKKGLNNLLLSMNSLFNRNSIFVNSDSVASLRTDKDYVNYAVLSLLINSLDHAFNSESDNDNLLCSIDKELYICGQPLSEKASFGFYEVEVFNNGLPIPEENLEHVFDKGFTIRKNFSGDHGIGLWGVKEFVEENGGSIFVESKIGKTSFKFTIPYSEKIGDLYIQ
ncbi:MAG: hypothetical protein KKF89_03130 [Nanoarchaeota archaeon]|nr:hypothetical protein [Nanoarchaeota archaeon]MBU1854688.1 hypothetical protein [Nanoarchaeota archaeon]